MNWELGILNEEQNATLTLCLYMSTEYQKLTGNCTTYAVCNSITLVLSES